MKNLFSVEGVEYDFYQIKECALLVLKPEKGKTWNVTLVFARDSFEIKDVRVVNLPNVKSVIRQYDPKWLVDSWEFNMTESCYAGDMYNVENDAVTDLLEVIIN